MDDTTRGIGGDRDDMTGRGDETTRNLDTTGSTAGTTRSSSPRGGAAGRARTTRATTNATASESGLDPETDRKTRQIQAEIADTREELSETIDALQEKLRPSNIVSEATDKVKSATTERVRHMAESAGETANEMMRSTRHATSGVVEGARQNAIPALMIGIGLTWLIVDRMRDQDNGNRYRGGNRSRDWRRSGYGAYGTAGRYDRSPSSTTELDYEDDADYGYAEYGSDYAFGADRSAAARDGVRRTGERASHLADNAKNKLRRSTRGAQNGLQRLLRNNPLLVGAAAMVAGAAVGAALPETERENELMGETRDSMIEKAQDVARNAASNVQNAAGDAVTNIAEKAITGEKS